MKQATKNIDVKIKSSFDTVLKEFSNINNVKPIIARPFVKWVGGKTSVLDKIKQHLPNKIDNYYELFVGGGALFFNIKNTLKNATLCDINKELMMTYKVIQNNVKSLIIRLDQHSKNHCKDYYYEIRNKQDLIDPIEVASRFIYLNKTCYNGSL